ncbi:beta family protein [Sphingomonas sp. Leaf23]|uniref:beta family protein n=1 Tax=Sphingomonas sp. Leaf23 TaxID=1735689 RepID=UPI000ADBD9E4|nr:hypothetical protein [Sphingomonas sp. Leaf23]
MPIANYFPSLTIRQSECEALRRLAEPTKDAIFPIARVQCWPHPKAGQGGPVERSIDHLSEAFGARPIGLDLAAVLPSPAKVYSDKKREDWALLGRSEVAALHRSANGFSSWCELIEQDQRWVPVVQWTDEAINLQSQVLRLASLGRGIIFRFRRTRGWNLAQASALSAMPLGDVPILMVYDYEQISRNDDLTAIGLGIQGGILATKSLINGGNRTHVFKASSFPDQFTVTGEEYACLAIRERMLFQMLSTSPTLTNAGIDLHYGDHAAVFASDREPAFRGVPRVDYPLHGEWIYHRRREGFADAALRVRNDPKWDDTNLCWGAQRIREAAAGNMKGLNAANKWTTIRLNIHMHTQATASASSTNNDEPWSD